MILAFTGWNDAAEGASGAVEHLLSAWREKQDDVVPLLIADVEAEEFYEIYKLDVVELPTNRPMIRKDFNDKIFRTEKEKYPRSSAIKVIFISRRYPQTKFYKRYFSFADMRRQYQRSSARKEKASRKK